LDDKQLHDNMTPRIKKTIVISASVLGGSLLAYAIAFECMNLPMPKPTAPGVTFSSPYAKELGLDPDQALAATLDDLKVRHFRIPAYWSLLESKKGEWDWTWLDRELDDIAARGGTGTLAIGQKLPRWPECWIPAWAMKLSETEREEALDVYLTAVVKRYQRHAAVTAWQVENEANFPFGTCPKYRETLLDDELSLVRSLDASKPILTTDSGELSFWSVGKRVDRLGTSVYRVVIGPLGIFRYDFVPPQLYLRKAQLLSWLIGIKGVYVSEFQMEPWVETVIPEATLAEQFRTMDLTDFKRNAAFSQRMGMDRIDYWGVEWWWWLKTTQQHPEFWEFAKTLFN
jgi:hypothetical protein